MRPSVACMHAVASVAWQRHDKMAVVEEARGWSEVVSPFRGAAHSSARRVRRPGDKRQGRSVGVTEPPQK
jgi:hypothetical protein